MVTETTGSLAGFRGLVHTRFEVQRCGLGLGKKRVMTDFAVPFCHFDVGRMVERDFTGFRLKNQLIRWFLVLSEERKARSEQGRNYEQRQILFGHMAK